MTPHDSALAPDALLDAAKIRGHGWCWRSGWQQCAIRPATEHLSDDQQTALHQIGPRERGLNHVTARLLLAATRGELDDRWFKTASNSERVGLQSLLKQRVLVTIAGQTQIVPAPETTYGIDPFSAVVSVEVV